MDTKKVFWSTVSNLSYFGAGLYYIFTGAMASDVYAGVMVLILGLVSARFHYGLEYFWQKADIVGIFGAFNAMLVAQLVRHSEAFAEYQWILIVGSLVLSIAVGLTAKRWDHETIGYLGVQNLIVLVVRAIATGRAWLIPVTAVLYGAGLFFGQKSMKYREGSVLYERYHTPWHLATGGAIFFNLF